MKKLFLAAITSLVLFASSCKKDQAPAPVPPPSLNGTSWNGIINFPSAGVINIPLALTFNAAGTMGGSITSGGTAYAITGTWNVAPNSTTVNMFFTIATVSGSYSGQATLTTNNSKLEGGTATNSADPITNCNFTATKSS